MGQLVGFYIAVNCLFCFTGGTMLSQLSMESPTASEATEAPQGFTVFRFLQLVRYNLAFNVIWFKVAEAGEGYLNIMANGGVGDVDIYVRFDEYPT